MKTMSYEFGIFDMSTNIRQYRFINSEIRKKIIVYKYQVPHSLHIRSIYITKKLYSSKEISTINSLFESIDEGNLAIIKGIIHSKTKRSYIGDNG